MINRIMQYLSRYPLARRTAFIVISWSLLLTVLATLALTISDYRNELSQLNSRMEQINTVEIPSLANSLWHLNQEQINTHMQGILNLQDVAYEQLVISGGDTLTAGHPVDQKMAFSQIYKITYEQEETTYEIGQLTVTADLKQLQQRVKSRLFRNLYTAAIQIFLLAGFILFVINRLFIKPLNEVVQYANKLSLDHLDVPLVIHKSKFSTTDDELDLVALRLNEMRMRLLTDLVQQQTMESALSESEKNYREIFNATTEAIAIQDTENGQILQVNSSMLTMFGFEQESEVIGLSVDEFSSNEEGYTQEIANKIINKTINEGAQIFEWRARKKNQELFWAEISLRKAEIKGKNRILAVIRDISESKRNSSLLQIQNEELLIQKQALEKARSQLRKFNIELEQRVKERTIQLADLNEELESFSYSVAHDLKSPLRSINAYSTLILQGKRDRLDQDTLVYLEKIQTASKKMETLIEDLLKLSKANRSEINISDINLAPIALEVLENLQKIEPDRKVEILVTPEIPAMADASLISIALDNLLRNAWKFTGKMEITRIKVGSIEKPGGRVYFISDNGVGFDMKLSEKMFKAFERFHPSSDFEGTGIGLAITKRIIKRHNGQIWAESEVNKGATFFFTLPEIPQS